MLKNVLILVGSCLVSVALQAQVRYDVSGKYEEGVGKKVYLEEMVGTLDGRTIDSTVVAADGTFVLVGEVADPLCAMVYDEDKGSLAVFLDGSRIALRVEVVKARKTGEAAG